jgi:ATP-binding dynein motor region
VCLRQQQCYTGLSVADAASGCTHVLFYMPLMTHPKEYRPSFFIDIAYSQSAEEPHEPTSVQNPTQHDHSPLPHSLDEVIRDPRLWAVALTITYLYIHRRALSWQRGAQGVEMEAQLKDIEDRIIQVLSAGQASILDDETALQAISSSKALSRDISERQLVAQKAEQTVSCRSLIKSFRVCSNKVFLRWGGGGVHF